MISNRHFLDHLSTHRVPTHNFVLPRAVTLTQGNPLLRAPIVVGKAALNHEENDKAIAEFEQAAKLDPNLPCLHFNLGLVYLARTDFEKARKGQILIRLGRAKEGQQELAQATDLLNASRQRRQNELLGGELPQPELSSEPKPH